MTGVYFGVITERSGVEYRVSTAQVSPFLSACESVCVPVCVLLCVRVVGFHINEQVNESFAYSVSTSDVTVFPSDPYTEMIWYNVARRRRHNVPF